MSNKVEPRTLPGFMELNPNEQVKFDQMKETIQHSYERFGFLPLDTPVIELSEVLLAKAGGEMTEEQQAEIQKNMNAMDDANTGGLAEYTRRADAAEAKIN